MSTLRHYKCTPEIYHQLPPIQDKHLWNNGTVLIAGDSILNGIDEKKLGKDIKCRAFPGAVINDMYYYLTPLLQKKPSFVILHVSSNDSFDKSSDAMMDELLQLKIFIEQHGSEVIISYPVLRLDNEKANYAMEELRSKLRELNMPCIENSNINSDHLGKRGLHLNGKGSGRLAMNFISFVRHL